MNGRRSLADLFRTAAMIVTVWTAFALFTASEISRIAPESVIDRDYARAMVGVQLVTGLHWATLTPVIIYIAERFPLLKPFRWLNVFVLAAVTPLLAIVRAAFGGLVQEVVEGGHDIPGFVQKSINIRFHRNVFLVVVIIGVVNMVLAARAAAARERSALTLKKEIANDELQRLRAAMQPRFLFAALDTVKALIASRPLVADRMLVQLGGVLRKMLDFEKRPDVSLAEELDVVDHCVALERTRTGGLFTTRVRVGDELLRARVPPLLLQAVVESAILVESAERGELLVEAWADNGVLTILVRSDDPRRSPGTTALEATRARLQRAFGDRASMDTRHQLGEVVTTLRMPLQL